MKKFSPVSLIRKYKFLIIGIAVIAGIAAYGFFNMQQTYTASALIEYTNSTAEEGLAPDGTEIDTSEIYSTDVMKEVFARMGLSYDDYNLDEFRSKVVVEPVMTSEEEAVQEAVNEQGEEVETQPTRYMVSLTLSHSDSSDPAKFAREILDNMLDVFLEKYGENHVNSGSFVNRVSEINMADYEYLEIIETIDSAVETTYQSISGYIEGQVNFVSSENGYSFQDMYQEFSSLLSNEIPDAYAYILNNKIAKDTDVLLAKYQNRIENYQLDNESSQTMIDDIQEIIDTYVRMMRESGNTNITYEYILNEIYDQYNANVASDGTAADGEESSTAESWVPVDETVQYDQLLENYVTNRSEYENAIIDIAYCQYIIDLYSNESEAGQDVTDVLTDVDSTAVYEDEDATDAEKQQTVVDLLDSIVEKTNTLYDRLIVLSEEYNQYAGAQNISLNSDITVAANIQTLLYSMIVVIVAAIMAALGVLIIGRMGDIINYYLYTDRILLMPNRAACDQYLKKNEKVMLANNFVCIAIMLRQVKEKNKQYGREACDEMMKNFARYLGEVFPQNDSGLMAVNGLGQFVLFMENTTEEQAEAYMTYLSEIVQKYNETAKCSIEYRFGIAEAETEGIFRIRELMICAINKSSKADNGSMNTGETSADDHSADTEAVQNEAGQPSSGQSKDQDTEQEKYESKISNLLDRLESMKNN